MYVFLTMSKQSTVSEQNQTKSNKIKQIQTNSNKIKQLQQNPKIPLKWSAQCVHYWSCVLPLIVVGKPRKILLKKKQTNKLIFPLQTIINWRHIGVEACVYLLSQHWEPTMLGWCRSCEHHNLFTDTLVSKQRKKIN